jgi:hypothetical protein
MQVCLLVSGLPPDTALTFVLLKGAAYSVASPESTLAQDLAFPMTSTLRFTIPLPRLEPWRLRTRKRSDLDREGVSSAYLALWLPHGLSSSTSAEDFAAAISVEEIPAPWGGPKSPIPLSLSVNLTDARSCVHQPLGLLLMSQHWLHHAFNRRKSHQFKLQVFLISSLCKSCSAEACLCDLLKS